LPEHGFTSVDRQPDPGAWAACLDKLRGEPFYVEYKRRLIELLNGRRDGRYLGVGAGTGDDAAQLAEAAACKVTALDCSFQMACTCRDRHAGVEPVVGDAGHLPFASGSFDGCRADRVLQHLPDPASAIAEIVRVLRPGGRLVVIDPDYDTQVLELADQALARKVLRYRADRMLRNGTFAHRAPAALVEAGLIEVGIEPRTLVIRDAAAVDNVMGLRTWAGTAFFAGALTEAELQRWEELFDAAVAAGHFLYAVTFFISWGIKAEMIMAAHDPLVSL
jgi:SAM-dependent methyltransferase